MLNLDYTPLSVASLVTRRQNLTRKEFKRILESEAHPCKRFLDKPVDHGHNLRSCAYARKIYFRKWNRGNVWKVARISVKVDSRSPFILPLFYLRDENLRALERFSFECRKVIGFAFTTLRDWLKRFAPLFYPIRRKTKTNCVTLACIFPRFASATCNYFEF